MGSRRMLVNKYGKNGKIRQVTILQASLYMLQTSGTGGNQDRWVHWGQRCSDSARVPPRQGTDTQHRRTRMLVMDSSGGHR